MQNTTKKARLRDLETFHEESTNKSKNSSAKTPRKSLKRQALAVGSFITALQLALAFGLAPNHRPAEVYAKLCAWDCGWYSSITKEGYHSTVPPTPQKAETSNVAFFPGFPYLARAAHVGLGIKAEIALVVIAQIFAVLFWATLWAILQKWKISIQGSLLVVLAILAHPAAIFLVAGYSESLFLSTLLLFILSSKSKPSLANSVSGIAMSATRIVGIPVSLFPLIAKVSESSKKRLPIKSLSTSAIASILASLGAVGFLAYCQFKYGRYDLYMETQRIGWGIQPDYGAILKWREFGYGIDYDRLATILSGFAFWVFAALEVLLWVFKKNRGLAQRLPLYVVSFMAFFITLSGLKCLGFRSMIRYTLPWSVLLVLCFAHMISRNFRYSPRVLNLSLVIACVAAAYAIWQLGVPHMIDFLNGRWFA